MPPGLRAAAFVFLSILVAGRSKATRWSTSELVVHFEKRVARAVDRVGLGFFVRSEYSSSNTAHLAVLVTEVADTEQGHLAHQMGLRTGMVLTKVQTQEASRRLVRFDDLSTAEAIRTLRMLPMPLDISFSIPGDCLVTLGTYKSVDYDEAFFFSNDAGGPYVFTGLENGMESFEKADAPHFRLAVARNDEWSLHMAGRELRLGRQQPDACYVSDEKKKVARRNSMSKKRRRRKRKSGAYFTPGTYWLYGIGPQRWNYRAGTVVAVCVSQVTAWLESGWVGESSVPMEWARQASRPVNLHAQGHLYARCLNCNVSICERVLKSGANEIVVYDGSALVDAWDPSREHVSMSRALKEASQNLPKDEAPNTTAMLLQTLQRITDRFGDNAVVVMSWHASSHPAFFEGGWQLMGGPMGPQRWASSLVQELDVEETPLGRGRLPFLSTVTIQETLTGADLGHPFSELGSKRFWGRPHRMLPKFPRVWIPLSSSDPSIRYADRPDALNPQYCSVEDVEVVCAGSRRDCTPWWAADLGDRAECPYGWRWPGDVTVPKKGAGSAVIIVSVFYGYVPIFYVLLKAYRLARDPGTYSLSFAAFVVFMIALQEGFFKRLSSQPRPLGSCNISCGMPSSHAAVAGGYLVLRLLDSMFRLDPNLQEEWHEAFRTAPKADGQVQGSKAFAVHTIFWCIMLMPVPMSRVILHDHTPEQVIVGSFLGFFEALLWTLTVRTIHAKFPPESYPRLFGVRHNYGCPREPLTRSFKSSTIELGRRS